MRPNKQWPRPATYFRNRQSNGFDSNDSSIDDIANLVSGVSGSKDGLGGLLKGFLK